LNGARSLATRFNPAVGLIKSWDKFEGYQYPVIIDNMMNLELLFWAARETGDSSFYNICVQHADNTLQHHFRPDHSCYHVVCYDTDGTVLARKNHQGYNDASAWARGQIWALYGYTVMYRETRQQRYLEQAEKIAAWFLHHPNLPADKVPYWDFNAPGIPLEERDASAAAVAAAALLELAQYTATQKQFYINNARSMLTSLSSPAYRPAVGKAHQFLLEHSVGSKTLGKEVNQPLVYADYYYLEALLRLKRLQ
jgi:rhamnogalacturonyl hydrolase YesR